MGPVYGDAKWKLFQSVKFVIVPSLHEPFGLVALEALSCKTLVLSSFVEGLAEFLDPKISINCGTTSESIEKAIQEAVDMPAEEYKARVEAGVQLASNYTWKKVAQQTAALYEHLDCYN